MVYSWKTFTYLYCFLPLLLRFDPPFRVVPFLLSCVACRDGELVAKSDCANYMEKSLYLKFVFLSLGCNVKFSSCAEVDAVYAGWREGRRQECGGSTCSHPPELAIRYPLPFPTHHHQIPSDWPHLSNPLSQSTAGIVWTSHGLRPPSRHPHANTAGAGCRALGDGRWHRAGGFYIETPSCYNDNMWWHSPTTPPDQMEKMASSLIWRTPFEL